MTGATTTLDLMRLPEAKRAEVELWAAELMAVTEPITRALASVASRLGVSYATALRKYYAFQSGGVTALFNRSQMPRLKPLDPEFIEWWKQLCQENGRKCAPAHRKFVRLFKSGAPIPGIGPEQTRFKLPRGYSYDNLMHYAPTRFELLAARQGLSAADAYRPLVFTTRQNMRVGQEIVFDDMWHDFEVIVMGQREPSRLLQLHAMDVFSGCLFDLATKPRIRRESDGTRENLSEVEMLFYVAHILEDHGYCGDGARLILEAGTATIRDESVQRAIFDLSGGKLLCHVGATSNAVTFAGQYAGASKGNFRVKAMLESFHNPLHNETSDLRQLPGQTGSNSRLNVPDDLEGRRRDVTKWLEAMPALPVELRQQLQLNLVEYYAADRLVRDIVERMNLRREHDLEGFVEAGLNTIDYELPGLGILSAGQFLARLETISDAAQRAGLKSFAIPQQRKMSPREAFNSGRSGLVKFRPEHTARMLYHARRSEPVTVGHDHLITFEDKSISPEPLRFKAYLFRPGDKFDAVLNPWQPDKLHLFKADGAWVGQIESWQRVDRTDVAALEARVGEAEQIKNLMRLPIRKRGIELTAERLIATRENIELLSTGVELTPTQKQNARALRKFDGDVSELAETASEKPESGPEEFSAEGLL